MFERQLTSQLRSAVKDALSGCVPSNNSDVGNNVLALQKQNDRSTPLLTDSDNKRARPAVEPIAVIDDQSEISKKTKRISTANTQFSHLKLRLRNSVTPNQNTRSGLDLICTSNLSGESLLGSSQPYLTPTPEPFLPNDGIQSKNLQIVKSDGISLSVEGELNESSNVWLEAILQEISSSPNNVADNIVFSEDVVDCWKMPASIGEKDNNAQDSSISAFGMFAYSFVYTSDNLNSIFDERVAHLRKSCFNGSYVFFFDD